MAKPAGAACNLNCAYCFFLKKDALYPEGPARMSDEVLESYLRQTIEAQQVPFVTIAWQGGEPTLMGLDFFRRSLDIEKRHLKPGTTVERTLQTNGTLLDAEWCEFLRENNYLVGLSMDGPEDLHDAYRRDKAGKPTFERVAHAARLMQEDGVDFNILCTVNAQNGSHPLRVYRFFRDELGARYLQFIPIVERVNTTGHQRGDRVTNRSVRPEQWGRFLIEVFDEWVHRDVGETFVLNFDGPLANWLGSPSTCVYRPTCGQGMAIERNGDVYCCDHYVEPDYLLGNIMQTPLVDLAASERQFRFGQDKRDTLPRYCLECDMLFACNGECPKNRLLKTPDGEPGLNYLCEGYRAFFKHVDEPMKLMAQLLRQGRQASDAMAVLAEAAAPKPVPPVRRNETCPCGSGKKYKHCHGGS
jgi:uncharacterized protein